MSVCLGEEMRVLGPRQIRVCWVSERLNEAEGDQ
jgi:hypothetical protein